MTIKELREIIKDRETLLDILQREPLITDEEAAMLNRLPKEIDELEKMLVGLELDRMEYELLN